jgi:hypothetical protein
MSCKITDLAETIIKSDKMSATDIIDFIGSEMEDGATTTEVYHRLYKQAYGEKITKELADCFVKSMTVTDGTDRATGMKWNYDTSIEVGNKISIDWHKIDKIDFYIALNMMYSDYFTVAKSYDLQNDNLFFAKMAKAWLCDDDVASNKMYRYYFNVVVD